eukprot:11044415-Ditylum_brightwellii.AAC.1
MDEKRINNALSVLLPTLDLATTTQSQVRSMLEKELSVKEGSLKKHKKRIRELLIEKMAAQEKSAKKKKKSMDASKKKKNRRAIVED